MNFELLLLIEKHTDKSIKQTKTKPQEVFEYKLKQLMRTFSFHPPINLSKEVKCLLAVTAFEATNSVFNKTNENKNFSVSTQRNWAPEVGEETINKINELVDPKTPNDIELHVKEFGKRGTWIEKENSGYNLTDFDHFTKEILAELRKVKYKDLEFYSVE